MSHKSLRIRRGRGLLANDNPVSTSPGRRIVGVFILGICAIPTLVAECLYSASARSLHWWPRIRAPSA